MNKYDDDVQEAIQVLDYMDVERTKVSEIKKHTLQDNLEKFFHGTLDEYRRSQSLKSEFEESLRQDLRNGEFDFEQKMRVLNYMSKDSNMSMDSFYDLFKPVAGSPGPFGQTLTKERKGDDYYDDMFQKYSPEELQALQKLITMMETSKKGTSE